MLTGVKDVDLKILQELRDDEISKVCSVNKYVAKLCNDETFWLNRLLKNYDVELIQEMKQDLTYKVLYRYLFLDRKKGLEEATKKDNLELFKLLFSFSSLEPDGFAKIVDLVGNNGSTNILNYLLLHVNIVESNIISDVLDLLNEKIFKWLNKMELTDTDQYFLVLLRNDDFAIVFPQMKKYIKNIDEIHLPSLLEVVAYYLKNDNLRERKIIFDLFSSSKFGKKVKENIEALMAGLESSVASQETKDKFLNYILSNKK